MHSIVKPFAIVALVALPVAACNTAGTTAGAAGGAVAGAVVGGPVGAVVGGAAGAAVGSALTPDETVRVRQYVYSNPRPSVRVREQVVVGTPLPSRVRLYEVPENVGVRTTYRYTVVNDTPVLVDPNTRTIVQVIE
ncbi:DUF1236 domain-containing protein [Microvirga massiliensis]|uniref:DUF1236 domain-containing protein n=1 Tax=Microvirga massiliensis TaxID=1033741 RepID=UPI00062B7D62|nr:DUF1236 domain-containing protein [Microvirga massiliensis]